MKCTFGGVWNGGGGDGQKNLLVASFFFDRAVEVNISSTYRLISGQEPFFLSCNLGKFGYFDMQAGFVDPNLAVAKVRPSHFEEAAKQACQTRLEDAKATYPRVKSENLPFLCMDLVYQVALLVDGFGE